MPKRGRDGKIIVILFSPKVSPIYIQAMRIKKERKSQRMNRDYNQ